MVLNTHRVTMTHTMSYIYTYIYVHDYVVIIHKTHYIVISDVRSENVSQWSVSTSWVFKINSL